MASFEDQLKSLEGIVSKLERGDLALEEAITLFETGITLSNSCKQELEAAEGKVQILLRQKNGELKPETFGAQE